VFEITIGDELIFSKKELGRFPEENEVEEMVKNKI
jgi:selenoprotein W-related protein